MEYRDYYKILGVSKSATEKEIKAAYRRLARKHHPDMNPGSKQAEARFKEINEAHEVLSDPEKRRRYDQIGSDWASYFRAGGRPGAGTGGRVSVNVDAGDLGGFSEFFRTFFGGPGFGGAADFEDMFERAAVGRRGSERAARRAAEHEADGATEGPGAGGDIEQPVELTLEEVLRGTTRTLRRGEGGSRRAVEVKIPAGVRDGSRVRVAGEGDDARGGGRRGDLYLRIRVLRHPAFEREGDDLQTTVTVPLTTAVLGGEAPVPTLDGPIGIKVPAGTPAGRTFRLRGHGLPHLETGGGRGDLLATLKFELPKSLSGREREIFEELRRLGH